MNWKCFRKLHKNNGRKAEDCLLSLWRRTVATATTQLGQLYLDTRPLIDQNISLMRCLRRSMIPFMLVLLPATPTMPVLGPLLFSFNANILKKNSSNFSLWDFIISLCYVSLFFSLNTELCKNPQRMFLSFVDANAASRGRRWKCHISFLNHSKTYKRQLAKIQSRSGWT